MKRERAYSAFAIALFCLLLIMSIFLPGKGVWMNIYGMIISVFGLIVLLAYGLSGNSNPRDLGNYVPLNVYDKKFRGAHMQIATRSGLTNQTYPDPSNYKEYSNFEDIITDMSWASFCFWIFLILLVVAIHKLIQKRQQQEISATLPVFSMMSLIAAAPLVCLFTLQTANFINAAGTFIILEILALLVFWGAWSKEIPQKQEDVCTSALSYNTEALGEPNLAEESTITTEVPLISANEPQIRFCRKCGSKVAEGSKFCNNCGTAIVTE